MVAQVLNERSLHFTSLGAAGGFCAVTNTEHKIVNADIDPTLIFVILIILKSPYGGSC
jgi:hypothetical protein